MRVCEVSARSKRSLGDRCENGVRMNGMDAVLGAGIRGGGDHQGTGQDDANFTISGTSKGWRSTSSCRAAVAVYDRLRAESGRLNYQDLLMRAARLLCDRQKWGQVLGSGRQGHNLTGESPVVSICSFRIRSDITVHVGNELFHP
jgi:hypothetical protein